MFAYCIAVPFGCRNEGDVFFLGVVAIDAFESGAYASNELQLGSAVDKCFVYRETAANDDTMVLGHARHDFGFGRGKIGGVGKTQRLKCIPQIGMIAVEVKNFYRVQIHGVCLFFGRISDGSGILLCRLAGAKDTTDSAT